MLAMGPSDCMLLCLQGVVECRTCCLTVTTMATSRSTLGSLALVYIGLPTAQISGRLVAGEKSLTSFAREGKGR
eukprot:scaffold223451_cov18-Tisochrysis_lutea.AAC.2